MWSLAEDEKGVYCASHNAGYGETSLERHVVIGEPERYYYSSDPFAPGQQRATDMTQLEKH